MAGRERQWEWIIDGKGYYPMRNQDGSPVYSTEDIPAVATTPVETAEVRREYASLHGGFGYARYLIPNTYDYGDCIDTTRPRRIVMPPLITSMTAPASVTGGFVELGSTFWVGAGQYLCSINTSNDTIATPDNVDYTKGFSVATAVISSLLTWDSLIDVWYSSAHNGRTFNGAVAPTELATAGQRRYSCSFFSENANAQVQAASATIGGDPAITWIAQGAAIDSAIGANWGAGYDIGDDSYPITGLSAGKLMAWCAKKDGLWYVDGRSGLARQAFKAYPINDNNGVGLFTDSMGRVWYPSQGGLLRYNPNNGAVEDVTPGRGLSHDATIYGRVTAVAQYRGWFYVSMYNGTTSYVMAGRDRDDGEYGTGSVVWHGAIAKLTGQISHMHVLGSTTPPRLYMAAGTTVAYIRLDAPYRYAASGSIYFPAETFGSIGSRWCLAGLVVSCTGFNTATNVRIYAKLDNGDWQPLNSFSTSGRVFIAPGSGSWLFTEIALRFDLQNAATTTTPEIWGVTILATQRVYTRQLIHTVFVSSREVLSRYGIKERRTSEEVLGDLRALAVSSPVTIIDYLLGEQRERSVLIQPIKTRLARITGDKDEWSEWAEIAEISMVTQSSPTISIQPVEAGHWGSFNWGSGTRWGAA